MLNASWFRNDGPRSKIRSELRDADRQLAPSSNSVRTPTSSLFQDTTTFLVQLLYFFAQNVFPAILIRPDSDKNCTTLNVVETENLRCGNRGGRADQCGTSHSPRGERLLCRWRNPVHPPKSKSVRWL